jgi:hypothetical protein
MYVLGWKDQILEGQVSFLKKCPTSYAKECTISFGFGPVSLGKTIISLYPNRFDCKAFVCQPNYK